jgi:hypothetical protein
LNSQTDPLPGRSNGRTRFSSITEPEQVEAESGARAEHRLAVAPGERGIVVRCGGKENTPDTVEGILTGTRLDRGDQTPGRRMDRLVVPVVAMVAMMVMLAIAHLVVPAIPLVDHHLTGMARMAVPSVVVAPVHVVDRDRPEAVAAPPSGVAMPVHPFDDDHARGDPVVHNRATPIGGVTIVYHDVARHRTAAHHDVCRYPLCL